MRVEFFIGDNRRRGKVIDRIQKITQFRPSKFSGEIIHFPITHYVVYTDGGATHIVLPEHFAILPPKSVKPKV